MKRSRFLQMFLLLAVLAAGALFVFAACSSNDDPPQSVYSFEGADDVHISKTVTEYDFTEGVTGFKDLEETPFEVDDSAVKFGEKGEYTVVYKIDDYTQSVKVYIYDLPQFTAADNTISYADAQTDAGLKKGLTAVDSFGTALDITVTQGIEAGSGGYIEYGEHTVKYSATDRVGNTAEFERTVTVSDADKPVFDPISIDLSDIEAATELGSVRLFKILFDGEELGSGSYTFTGGFLVFTEEFILAQELGEHKLFLATTNGYGETTWTLTDNQPANFSIDISDVDYAETVVLPKARLVGNQRNITFEYEIEGKSGGFYSVDASGDDSISFVPGTETQFTLTVTAKRGTEGAGNKEFNFQVHDDVYAWTVNAGNVYDNIYFDEGISGVYSAEQKHGTDTGSLYLTNATEGAGNVLIRFMNTDVIPGDVTALKFYVYNPSGAALETYIYTDSGYWLPPLTTEANILTQRVDIPAETGWHEVILPFTMDFSKGNMNGNMVDSDPSNTYAELRITTSDWTYSGEGLFGVYVSNIYLNRDHSNTQVSYDETGYTPNGLVGSLFTLPKENTADGRVHSDYALTFEDETPVTFNETAFTFTPEEKGTYTYTITTYWRETQIGEKTYTIKAGAVALPAALSYEYNFETGVVTLPAAQLSEAFASNTVRYTVTPAAGGEATVLGEDRVFTCTQVGSYIYKAEVLGSDGSSVIDSSSAEIYLSPSNVLIGFGQDASAIDASKLGWNSNPGTTFTYDPSIKRDGELGSLKMNNDGHTGGEIGNFALQLRDTDIANESKLTQIIFWIYVPANVQLNINVYSQPTWMYSNFWYNGQQCTSIEQYPVQGKGEWQKIEFNIRGDVDGNDIRLQFKTNSEVDENKYAWEEGVAADIYLSNIYYKLV